MKTSTSTRYFCIRRKFSKYQTRATVLIPVFVVQQADWYSFGFKWIYKILTLWMWKVLPLKATKFQYDSGKEEEKRKSLNTRTTGNKHKCLTRILRPMCLLFIACNACEATEALNVCKNHMLTNSKSEQN